MKTLFYTIVILSLVSCLNSQNEKALHEFKKIDEELTKSIIEDGVVTLYTSIDVNRNYNYPIAKKADSIFDSYNNLIYLVDSITQNLRKLDKQGENREVSLKLLNENNLGKMLLNEINVFTELNLNFVEKSESKLKINKANKMMTTSGSYEDWLKINFEKTPTVAAISILKMIKNKCQIIACVSLGELSDKINLSKKGIGSFEI